MKIHHLPFVIMPLVFILRLSRFSRATDSLSFRYMSAKELMIDQDWIKSKAQELGCSVTKLLALSRTNDPFYVGTPTSREQAAWFADVWRRGGFGSGVHLRRVHYWCVSQPELVMHNGQSYQNTLKCWEYILLASKYARYLSLVGCGQISDHKSPEPHVVAMYQSEPNARFTLDIPALAEPYVWINNGDGFNLAMAQPYHLEVWVEKSTMDDVLLPICRPFHANLVIGEGEMTLTSVHTLIQRLKRANKPARIFYISDFDPAGFSVPFAVSRKIEYLLQMEGLNLDVKLHRLLLNREHIDAYQLPRTPIKETEKRGASFQAQHGEGAVELDALEALHPGILARVVTNALRHFHDAEAERTARLQERQLRQAIQASTTAITSKYVREIQAVEGMYREMAELQLSDTDAYEPVQAAATADDHAFSWLYDTDREYLEQIHFYKAYAQGQTTDAT